MSRLLLMLPVLLLASLLTGCVSTDVFDVERHPDFRDRRYSKLLVHCSAEDETRRAIVEAEVAESLRRAGYEATASYQAAPQGPKRDFRLRDYPGHEALVWVGYGSYENVVTEYPGYVQTWVGGGFGYGRFGGGRFGGGPWGWGGPWGDPFWGGPGVGVSYVPPQTISRWWLKTRIELVDAASENKVFSARAASRARNPDSLEDLARDLGGEIVRLMSDHRER